jgi:thiamine-phosphate pyrophosphorylase
MMVHLITDRRRLVPGGGDFGRVRACLVAQVRHAVEAGVDAVQVRERDLEARELADLVAELVGLTAGSRTRIIVNDRVDIALACGAGGVHLRADSMSPEAVRTIAPSGFIIGRSVHTVDEAVAAKAADYLIAGTVWATPSKPGGALLGLAGFAAIAHAVVIPTLGIGGVTVERAGAIAAAGGAGVAAIGLFLGRESQGCRAVSLETMVSTIRQQRDTVRQHDTVQ